MQQVCTPDCTDLLAGNILQASRRRTVPNRAEPEKWKQL
jgi:hypothetical protein